MTGIGSRDDMLKRRTLFSLILFLIALFFTLFRLPSSLNRLGTPATWVLLDYKIAIYYPVVAFLAGDNPYQTEKYLAHYPVEGAFPLFLPSTLLLNLPFGLLPLMPSLVLYLLFTLVLTLALGYLSLVLTKQEVRLSDIFLLGALILFSRAGRWNVLLGQLTLQFTLISYVALYFAKRSPIISGLGLAMSVIKPTWGIPIALLMLSQGHVKPVLYGGIVASVMNLPLLILLAQRAGGIDTFFSLLLHNHNVWQNNLYNNPALSNTRVDAIALISRFIEGPIGGVAELTIFALILGVAGWMLRRGGHTEDEEYWTLGVGVVCLATLLCTYHQPHDLLLLTLPFVGLVGRRFPKTFYSSYRYRLSVLLLSILAMNYAPMDSIMRFVPQGSGFWLFLVSINGFVLLTLFSLWVRAFSMDRARLSKYSISSH